MEYEDIDPKGLALYFAGRLCERVVANPVSTLAGAATFGYVLGWAVPTPLYRTLASLALRAVAMQVGSRLLGAQQDEDEDLEDEDLDLSGTGNMPGDARQADVPPYVA